MASKGEGARAQGGKHHGPQELLAWWRQEQLDEDQRGPSSIGSRVGVPVPGSKTVLGGFSPQGLLAKSSCYLSGCCCCCFFQILL